MLALLVTLLAPAPPVDVVLLAQGDALLLACHDAQAGWYHGRACQKAAAGAKVRGDKPAPLTLPAQAKLANCGGTEGHLSFGPVASEGPIFSAHRAPRACPERKPYSLPDAVAHAIRDALTADQARNPAPYAGYPPSEKDKRPFSDGFSVDHAVVIDVEGKGHDEEIISLQDMAKGLHALVRVDGTRVTVLRVSRYGPVAVTRGDCGDFDGDGVAELIVRNGGETERVYELLRFVHGEAEIVASMGCGD